MNLESCAFTLSMCLVITQNPFTRKVSIVSYSNLQAEGLRV